MANRISFHIQHAAKPSYLEKIIIFSDNNNLIDTKRVESSILSDGFELIEGGIQRTLDLANKLGILSKTLNSKFKLEMSGEILKKLAFYKHDVYTDLIHYLLYSRWELNNHQDYWSWSYSKICEMFWDNCPEIENRKIMFGQVSALAEKSFPGLDAVLGTETIGAVSSWLKELDPPFFILDEGKLVSSKNREWFSPELALFGIYYLYIIKKVTIRTPILLNKSTINLLVPLCLTTNETILSMIDIASKTYPFLEIHTGEWGSSAILKQNLDLSMIV